MVKMSEYKDWIKITNYIWILVKQYGIDPIGTILHTIYLPQSTIPIINIGVICMAQADVGIYQGKDLIVMRKEFVEVKCIGIEDEMF